MDRSRFREAYSSLLAQNPPETPIQSLFLLFHAALLAVDFSPAQTDFKHAASKYRHFQSALNFSLRLIQLENKVVCTATALETDSVHVLSLVTDGSLHIKDQDDLLEKFKSEIIMKLVPGVLKPGYQEPTSEPRPLPPAQYPPAQYPALYPARHPFVIGDADRNPLPSFPSTPYGGMYMGPDHPGFANPAFLPPGAVPPGARFDPIVPGGAARPRPPGRLRSGEPDPDELPKPFGNRFGDIL